MKILDSHQHYWKYSKAAYPWINPSMDILKSDYLPCDIQVESRANGVVGGIAIQARQVIEENDFLLGLASSNDFIKVVVGWVDLNNESVEDDILRYKENPYFKGVRHLLQDEPDDKFILNPSFMRGLSFLQDHNLTYDFLVSPKHLPYVFEVVKSFPALNFVIDHLAKPSMNGDGLKPWSKWMAEIGSCQNVFCKVSGMITEAEWKKWRQEDFFPFMEIVHQCFGSKKLMIGSDWPVCLLSGSYSDAIQLPITFFEKISSQEMEDIAYNNAAKFYKIS